MERFAVMGNPIAHSLSPKIHDLFASLTGRVLCYEKIAVEASNFKYEVTRFFENGGRGLNITRPHKELAFELSDEVSERCLEARAANTLWQKEGVLYADNTDGVGLLRDITYYLKTDLSCKKVLLLGAGGAARGVLGPLLFTGAKVTIANRTKQKARRLQQDFMNVPLVCSMSQLESYYDVVINATAASLDGAPLCIAPSVLAQASLCYDLAYVSHGETAFVKEVRALGGRAVDGLGMLIEQAAESFHVWHGVMPDTIEVRRAFNV